jgi:hypothetical protein
MTVKQAIEVLADTISHDPDVTLVEAIVRLAKAIEGVTELARLEIEASKEYKE